MEKILTIGEVIKKYIEVRGRSLKGIANNIGEFRIEHFEDVRSDEKETDGVIIIWCASLEDGKKVIVGWYENAKVYREHQYSIHTVITGIDKIYFSKAKAEDCYLLPEELRTFEIGMAAKIGKGKGFGQSNYWYADSEYAKTELIPKVMQFISEHRKDRINKVSNFFEEPEDIDVDLSDEELENLEIYYANEEYDKCLPLAYRKFRETQEVNAAFYIATALKGLYQFSLSKKWYEKVEKIEGGAWDTYGNMVYLYQQLQDYEKSNEIAKALLQFPESEEIKAREEIYSIIADNEHYLGNNEEAIKYLDKILDITTNADLSSHTQRIKQLWS